MDYNWEASIAAANVQQGLAAMAVHGSPSADHQQDRQVRLSVSPERPIPLIGTTSPPVACGSVAQHPSAMQTCARTS